MLWGIGTHLGWAEQQDKEGNLIHDVKVPGPCDRVSDSLLQDTTAQKAAQGNQTNVKAYNESSNVRGFQTNVRTILLFVNL